MQHRAFCQSIIQISAFKIQAYMFQYIRQGAALFIKIRGVVKHTVQKPRLYRFTPTHIFMIQSAKCWAKYKVYRMKFKTVQSMIICRLQKFVLMHMYKINLCRIQLCSYYALFYSLVSIFDVSELWRYRSIPRNVRNFMIDEIDIDLIKMLSSKLLLKLRRTRVQKSRAERHRVRNILFKNGFRKTNCNDI